MGASHTHVGTQTQSISGKTWAVHTVEGTRKVGGVVQSHRSTLWVYTPKTLKHSGVILGLPGWKFPARSWEDEARISEHADALGVVVALASMHTTVYESAFYPQSRTDRKWCGPGCTFAGSPWVG